MINIFFNTRGYHDPRHRTQLRITQLTLLKRHIDLRLTYQRLPSQRRDFIDQRIIRIVSIKRKKIKKDGDLKRDS
jgi:hypothetical protein